MLILLTYIDFSTISINRFILGRGMISGLFLSAAGVLNISDGSTSFGNISGTCGSRFAGCIEFTLGLNTVAPKISYTIIPAASSKSAVVKVIGSSPVTSTYDVGLLLQYWYRFISPAIPAGSFDSQLPVSRS